MNSSSLVCTSIAVFVALTLAITISSTTIGNIQPGYAQPTFDTPSTPGSSSPNTGSSTADDGENFQQFMDCLFGGEVSEEDISSALEGSSASTPTEQEIRDCFAPLYNTGSAAGSTTTTTPGSGSTDETEDAGGDEDEGEGEGEDSTSGTTSEDDDESEE
jgi:hypothetical protein